MPPGTITVRREYYTSGSALQLCLLLIFIMVSREKAGVKLHIQQRKTRKSPRADARGDVLRRMNCFRGGLAAGAVGIAAAPVAAASVAAAAAVTTAEEQQENDDNDPAAVTAKETVVIAHSRTSNEIVD